jgi:hypothetical protein
MPGRLLAAPIVVLIALLLAVAAGWCGEEAAPADSPPPLPKGIEVQARGPVHEAFASLAADPVPTRAIGRKPPRAIDEVPPAEKPEGNVIWIGGYWGWDDERKDFLWISGVWRTPPPGKKWVPGYWREQGDQWQWVPGFWTAAAPQQQPQQGAGAAVQEVTYLPTPPAAPAVAPPVDPPQPDAFYVPGVWLWQGTTYQWRPGYWARVQPGYVWVPDHYRWTPSGVIFVAGYWDLALSRRGILYAPVVINPGVVTASFYYTPVYAVSSTVMVDALFVRPSYCHYYFGDYYGPAYVGMGFQSYVVFGRGYYDPIFVYERWGHRAQPNWVSLQINIYNGRFAGRMPCPPRTLVQQNIIIQKNITHVTNVTRVTNVMVAPARQVAAAQGVRTVALDSGTRSQARVQAAAMQQVAVQRTRTEAPLPPGSPRQARAASLSVPTPQAVRPGFTPAQVTPQAASHAQAPQPMHAPSTPAASPHPSGVAGPVHPGGMTAPSHLSAPVMPGQPGHATAPPGHPGGPGMPPAHRPPPPRPQPRDHHERR